MNPQSSSSLDQPYAWGREPSTYLAPRELVRLTLLRSRIEDRAELRNRVVNLSARRRRAARRTPAAPAA
jgi:hypothetical protein